MTGGFAPFFIANALRALIAVKIPNAPLMISKTDQKAEKNQRG